MRASWVVLGLLFVAAGARAETVADALKGRVIVSDKALPKAGTSASEYEKLGRGDIVLDKSGKVTLYFAAFTAKPMDDAQVKVTLYDITSGANEKAAWLVSLEHKGDRSVFTSLALPNASLPDPGDRKYRVVVEHHGTVASGEFGVLKVAPPQTGTVHFTPEKSK
jgi:hypothetical protein